MSQPSAESPAVHPSFRQAFWFWLKLGFISFGGPTGQIAIMQTELVEKRRWIDEPRFLHALNYCMLLPGPEAQQLATYVGWLLHGKWGGIVAGSLFVLPSAVLLWVLSYVYVRHGDVTWIASLFDGLKPAVAAIVAFAVWRIGRRALKNPVMWSVAALAFVAIYFFEAPFPAIIASAALIGLVGGRVAKKFFVVIQGHGGRQSERTRDKDSAPVDGSSALHDSKTSPSLVRALKVLLVCGALWISPVLLVGWSLGFDSTSFQEGVFFSKAALVTFGGAYAVLPYVAQQAVENFEWLSSAQMLDGLGLAETTPGPLIMVLQFVGFLGGYHHPGSLEPLSAATLGAAITTWTTFLPCFLFIFLGAPYVERLRERERLSAVLSTITASVVGVVLNLAVWFALEVLMPVRTSSAGEVVRGIDFYNVAVAAISLVLLLRFKVGVIPLVLGAALLGILRGC